MVLYVITLVLVNLVLLSAGVNYTTWQYWTLALLTLASFFAGLTKGTKTKQQDNADKEDKTLNEDTSEKTEETF